MTAEAVQKRRERTEGASRSSDPSRGTPDTASSSGKKSTSSDAKKKAAAAPKQSQLTFAPSGRSSRTAATKARGKMAVIICSLIIGGSNEDSLRYLYRLMMMTVVSYSSGFAFRWKVLGCPPDFCYDIH